MRRIALLPGALVALILLAASSAAAAPPTVAISSPSSGLITTRSFTIDTTVTSTLSIRSVIADVDGVQTPLSTGAPGHWNGTFTFANGAVFGPKTLTVTATDVGSATGSASEAITYDVPPTFAITSPYWGLADSSMHLVADCVTNGQTACTSISVSIANGGPVLATATSHIDTNVSMAAYVGKQFWLRFEATDALGATSTTPTETGVRGPYTIVDPSWPLEQVYRAGRWIGDFDGSRLVYCATTDCTTSSGIHSLVDGSDVTMPINGWNAYLTSYGAISAASASGEWRSGALVALPNWVWMPEVKGSYAFGLSAWGVDAAGDMSLVIRNLTTDTDTLFKGYCPGNAYWPRGATNGDLVWDCAGWNGGPYDGTRAPQWNVYRYRGGTITNLTDAGCDAHTDGTNVSFRGYDPNAATVGCGGHLAGNPYSVYLVTPSGTETLVAPILPATLGLTPGFYNGTRGPGIEQLRSGWTAFDDPTSGTWKVKTRSPSGVVTTVTPWTTDSALFGLNSVGDVVVVNGDTTYLIKHGAPPLAICGAWQAVPVPVGTDWYFIVGQEGLYRLSTAGWSDAGADAGGPAAPGGAAAATTPGGTNPPLLKAPDVASGGGGSCSVSPLRGRAADGVLAAWAGLLALALLRRRR